ncbi:MAG: hypothetical protein V1835_06745 [Candidatus Micrarchaeota archaeon]
MAIAFILGGLAELLGLVFSFFYFTLKRNALIFAHLTFGAAVLSLWLLFFSGMGAFHFYISFLVIMFWYFVKQDIEKKTDAEGKPLFA